MSYQQYCHTESKSLVRSDLIIPAKTKTYHQPWSLDISQPFTICEEMPVSSTCNRGPQMLETEEMFLPAWRTSHTLPPHPRKLFAPHLSLSGLMALSSTPGKEWKLTTEHSVYTLVAMCFSLGTAKRVKNPTCSLISGCDSFDKA